jgi:hypothetical protein
MRRVPIPNLVLAATLALMLPLEQAHCAWMGVRWPAVPLVAATAAASDHACCKPHPATGPNQPAQPEQGSRGCICEQLPTGVIPQVSLAGPEAPSVTALAEHTAPAGSAPVSELREAIPALDVGSPPLSDDPGAHGLRAPPALD